MALADNPLLTVLGRRGRGAVVDALRSRPDRSWGVRGLARAAGVSAMTASRAVRELAALGVLDVFRPGRDMVVRWEEDAAASRLLQELDVADFRAEGIAAFSAAYQGPRDARLVAWTLPDDDLADPLCPGRVAVLSRDEDAAFDAIGPALDATAAAGWPRPEVDVFDRAGLDGIVGAAVLAGRPLGPTGG